jgi:carbon monoxide dehydrogenase subunit G
MKLSTEIPVDAAADEVRRCTHDLAWILGCVPGVTIEEAHDDGSCAASITVDGGEFSITMRGVAALDGDVGGDGDNGDGGDAADADAADADVVLRASGRDRMGTLKAVAEVRVSVAPDEVSGGLTIGLDADLDFSGVLAAPVRLHGKSTIKKLMRKTATTVATRLAR